MYKEYPLYEYVSCGGTSIKFAYKYTEDEMYNDGFNNGLYHYTYFEDRCKKYIKERYGIIPFYRERSGPITISSTELFFHNLFNKNKKIVVIKPILYSYNKNDKIDASHFLSDRYKTIVAKDADSLDMVSWKYTGTRAYADLIAKANGLQDYRIKSGQALRIPIDLVNCGREGDNIYEIKSNQTLVQRLSSLDKFYKLKNDDSFKPMEGTLFIVNGHNPPRAYVYTNGEYIQICS